MAVPVDDTVFEPLFPDETEDAIRARWEAWANEGLTPNDVDEWTDVREGSFWFIHTGPGIRESARTYDLMTEFAAAAIPSRSWGTYLDDLAQSYGTERNEATAAGGEVTFVGAVGSLVDPGVVVSAEAVDDSSELQEYETTGGGTITDPLGVPTGLTAADAAGGTLAPSTTYRYVVTAINAGGETLESAEASDATTVGNKTINLGWDDLVGATGYRVYRSAGAGPPYDFIAETVVSGYVDDGSVAPSTTLHPPIVDTTGGQVTLAVTATSTGSATNAAAGAVNILDTDVAGIESVINAEPLRGGTDPEGDESLSGKVSGQFVPAGPGNLRDYERWGLEYDGVGRVIAVGEWNGPGTVLMVLLTAEGDPVSPAKVTEVQNGIDPVPGLGHGQAPVGATVTVTTATAVTIDIGATIETETGFSLDGGTGELAIRDDLEAVVTDYLNSVQPGSEIVLQKIVGRLISHPGVHDVGAVTVEGGSVNVSLDADPAQVAVPGTVTLVEGVL